VDIDFAAFSFCFTAQSLHLTTTNDNHWIGKHRFAEH
jgi:hypothetical protein